MRSSTVVEVSLDERGRSVVHTLHCEAPLLVRAERVAACQGVSLLLVGGAAGPLGGDELSFVLRVGDGASVAVRSVAAMMAHPGAHGATSVLHTTVEVGDGARLDWCTQPLISVVGSDHRSVSVLRASATANVRFAEAVLLGRHEEQPGRLSLRQRVEVGGGVVLDHEVVLGAGAPTGPGAHGDVRWMQSEVIVGEAASPTPVAHVAADRVSGEFPLAPGVSLTTSAGSQAEALLV